MGAAVRATAVGTRIEATAIAHECSKEWKMSGQTAFTALQGKKGKESNIPTAPSEGGREGNV
jgi:hypothetical protein